jgi:hypothetical protein
VSFIVEGPAEIIGNAGSHSSGMAIKAPELQENAVGGGRSETTTSQGDILKM